MIEAYLNLQMALDEEYYHVVIEPYYRDIKLSFLLAHLCLTRSISDHEIAKWALSDSIIHDDLFFAQMDTPLSHFIQNFDTVLQYLRSPWRSRQYSIKLAGGRLYSNALLYCLHSIHDVKFYGDYLLDHLSGYSRKYLRSYDQRDIDILAQLAHNGSRNNNEEYSRSSTDTTLNLSNYLESLQTFYEDDPSIPHGRTWGIIDLFPRAGRCDKLLHLCKTKSLPKNFYSLQEKKKLFRAMEAYVDRWKDGGSGSPEVDEWAYPFPLVERRVSIFKDEEKEAIIKLRAQSST